MRGEGLGLRVKGEVWRVQGCMLGMVESVETRSGIRGKGFGVPTLVAEGWGLRGRTSGIARVGSISASACTHLFWGLGVTGVTRA